MRNKIVVFILLLLCLSFGCKKEEFAPHVEIAEILDVSYNSVVLAVRVDEAVFKGMTMNDLVGVRCSKTSESASDFHYYEKVTYFADWDESVENVFVVRAEYITFSGNCYCRPFVVLDNKYYYGDEEIIVHRPDDQFVFTHDVEEVTATSAVCGGEIVAVEGVELAERGVCWGTEKRPSLENDSFTVDGVGAGVFTSHLTDLIEGEYYFRAYSKTSYGTVYYGEEKILCAGNVPEVKTDSVTRISCNSAKIMSTIKIEGTFLPTSRGVCWSTEPNPTVINDHTSMYVNLHYPHIGEWIGDLKPNTTYYVRAYARNKVGIGYGEQLVFTTLTKHK